MKRFSYLLILMFIGCITSVAADIFTMQSPTTVVQGQKFQVKYIIGSSDASSFQPPLIEGCDLLYGPGRSTSISSSNINGRMTTSYQETLTYTYSATTAGKYTIPGVTVKINGQSYSTTDRQIEVLPPDKNSPQQSSNSSQSASSSAQSLTKDDIFIRVFLNKKQVYEQEAIEMTVKLYSRSNSVQFVDKAPDSYDGFLVEEIPGSGQWENMEHYNGSNYYTSVLKRAILFPQKTGELTVGSGSYEAVVIEYEREVIGYMHIATRPVERHINLDPGKTKVTVLPLPQPAPAGFNGAVGKFNITSELSDYNLRTGDAATLTLKVAGNGNLKGMSAPEISFPIEFEQYPPREDSNVKISGGTLAGSITYEYTFVPQSVGQFSLPAIDFSYFNPSTKQYETLSTQAYTLNVSRGNNISTTNNISQQEIVIKNTDIRHIKEGDKNLSFSRVIVGRQVWYWLLYPILVVGLLCLLIGNSLYRKERADVSGRKTSNANRVARRRLKKASEYLKAGNTERLTEEILRALWGYLGDKLTVPTSELGRANITELLQRAGAPQTAIDDVITALDSCEMARYSGVSSGQSAQEIYDLAIHAINSIESSKFRK